MVQQFPTKHGLIAGSRSKVEREGLHQKQMETEGSCRERGVPRSVRSFHKAKGDEEFVGFLERTGLHQLFKMV
jgi:hypothetical protein